MAHRTDSANSSAEPRHLPEGPADAEFLEATKFRYVEAGIGHLVGIVQVNRDLGVTFNPRHRIDDDTPGHGSYSVFLAELALTRFQHRLLAPEQRFQDRTDA